MIARARALSAWRQGDSSVALQAVLVGLYHEACQVGLLSAASGLSDALGG